MSVDLSRLEAVTARLEALEGRLGTGGGSAMAKPAAGGGGGGPVAPFVKAYDDFLAEHFAPVQAAAKTLGAADVEVIVGAFGAALQAQKQMLVVASKCKKPSDSDLQKALKATSEGMAKVDSLKDRRSKMFNHLAMVAEGAACLQWVVVEPTPAPYLSDVIPGSDMYGNKIMMEWKGKDENHVAFAKAFRTLLLELQKYVKQHHTTGLVWNPSGGTDYSAAAAGGPPAPPAGGPPKAGGPPAKLAATPSKLSAPSWPQGWPSWPGAYKLRSRSSWWVSTSATSPSLNLPVGTTPSVCPCFSSAVAMSTACSTLVTRGTAKSMAPLRSW
mmetsp:Transcript_26758/g.65927  ORF Transcript_26758/g.65927 Transcript_26758/m.65927 type:complete len:328 (+) Transcript_26758:3-986(+)